MSRNPLWPRLAVAVLLVAALAGGIYGVRLLSAPDVERRPNSPSAASDRETIALGQAVYLKHCASCHGRNLEGEPNWRARKPSGKLPAPPHDATGHTWHHADNLLFRIIKQGTAALAPAGYKTDMPGYSSVLTDREIRAVIAFIKSRWPAEIRRRQAAMNRR